MPKTAFTLYLASNSIRRRELLEQLGIKFQVIRPNVDESILPSEKAEDYVLRLAELKASAGWNMLPFINVKNTSGTGSSEPDLVLGADTIVVCKGEIIGKPRDSKHATEILLKLSGRTHQVMTAIALVNREKSVSVLSTSVIEFREITEDEIARYWLTGEPVDKAGSYAIQGLGALFVKRIEGSYSGVVGLPIFETVGLLGQFGFAAEKLFSDQQNSR